MTRLPDVSYKANVVDIVTETAKFITLGFCLSGLLWVGALKYSVVKSALDVGVRD